MTYKKLITIAISSILCSNAFAGAIQQDATEFTKKENAEFRNYLNFADKQDFEDATKGFIATWDQPIIKDKKGNVVWDFEKYSFLNDIDNIDTINPSLLRQAQLNNKHGLFKVKDGIYQIRGFDLSVMTFVETNNGWIVIDPLISEPVAEASMKMVNKYLGEKPVKAIIFTHSHLDHFGGVLGVVSREQVENGEVQIIAPDGFFEHSVTENLIAGNIMSRRSTYQGGIPLEIGPKGRVDSGLGKAASVGKVGILEPTIEISKTGEKLNIDGVDMIFQMANGSEAPSEFMFYFPQHKTLMSAEVMTHTLHNTSTLRGAKTRDVLAWSNYIDESIDLFSNAEIMIGSHHWPTWGNEKIIEQLEKTRDTYKYIHDRTLHLANKGLTPNEISKEVKLPDELGTKFYNRGYYGTVSHNVRAVYDFYFGAWWDGNPANLNPLSPTEKGKKYIEYFGEENLYNAALKAYEKGEYRWSVTLTNDIIFANPENKKAKDLEANSMEQLGYQSESAIWRNYYLTGAKELRYGINKEGDLMDSSGILTEMPVKSFLEYMTITLDADKAVGVDKLVNLYVGDKEFALDLSNSVLKSYDDRTFENADLIIKITEDDYKALLIGKLEVKDAINKGILSVSDVKEFELFMKNFVKFDTWLGIVTP